MTNRKTLAQSARATYLIEGVYGLSVCSLPDSSADEIVEAVGQDRLPHSKIREANVGLLRSYGFDVVPTGPPGHATLTLDGPPTELIWDTLEEAFSDARPNPVARKD